MSTADTTSPFARTRLANGRSPFLGRIDHRSVPARRWRELHKALRTRFPDDCGPYIENLCATLAGVQLQLELERSKLAAGKRVDTASLVKLANVERRLLRDLAEAEADDEQED